MGYYIPAKQRITRPKPTRMRGEGKQCPYCGCRMTHKSHPNLKPTQDHMIPKSRGGWRVIIVCLDCNHRKADKMPAVWLLYLEREMPDRVDVVRALFQAHGVLR